MPITEANNENTVRYNLPPEEKCEPQMANVFFSYSHKDEELRNELEVHLAMLKREDLIEAWHDRRIGVGEDIHSEISSALESADIVLLLVSAHFLASNYCFDIEMSRALQKHNQGTVQVIPVILHPCDWHSAPFGHLRATPTDGKPISRFANRDEALALVARDIRDAVQALGKKIPTKSVPQHLGAEKSRPTEIGQSRSSNLRVKRSFSEEEVDSFLEETFEYISRYFEASLQELSKRNPQITTTFRRVDANCFTASIYDKGKRASECTIWMGGRDTFHSGIAYSIGITNSRSQYNESLSVDNDGYSLHLRALGMSMSGMKVPKNMSQEGAGEFYWGILIERLQ